MVWRLAVVGAVLVAAASAASPLCMAGTKSGVCITTTACNQVGGKSSPQAPCTGAGIACCTDIICSGSGLCMKDTLCSGAPGLGCPGGNDYVCCTEPKCSGNNGTCLTTSGCAATGRKVIDGTCNGPDNYKCCEKSVPVPGVGKYDKNKFFAEYLRQFGANSLPDTKKTGLISLLNSLEADTAVTLLQHHAYMLATVKHEVADTYRPIEEYGKGQGKEYGKTVKVTDPEGRVYYNAYYGRGFVQLTWEANYRKMGQMLGNRMLYEPRLALDPVIAYKVMSYGMRLGSFTGKKLNDYITASKVDYVNARRIINGMDRADMIAGYARKFETCLKVAKP